MKRIVMAAAVVASAVAFGGTAQAQGALEGRVDRLEREMRAVQRKVFPTGAGQSFEPEITAPTANSDYPGLPASTPITDLTARVTALEAQVATLTGQVEQLGYRQRQLEDAFNGHRNAAESRLTALERNAAAAAPPVAASDPVDAPVAATPARRPSGARAEQVAAVERPNSGDAAEDQYTYGYRLWAAKLYPEARRELEQVVRNHPQHRRASWAQNLLGRAYLDAGAPSMAAVAFYENYKKNPRGERAADSLYYLAQSLVQLKKPAAEVCKVYDQLMAEYGTSISASMTQQVAEGRARSKCR